MKLELDLTKDYLSEILSYYIWGQSKAPSKDELANSKWMDRKEMTVKVDASVFAQKYKHLFNLKDLKLMKVFFGGKTYKNKGID